MVFSLNGEWQLTDNENITCKATVPGCNFADLISAGEIDDPYYAGNEKKYFPLYKKDWKYSRSFNIDGALLQNEKVFLVCEMLDTVCQITINKKHLADTFNMHRTYRFDIKQFLNEGENTIEVLCVSPDKYIEQRRKLYSLPHNAMGLNGCPHVRKSPCHFGWDFAPTLPACGITRDIYIEAYNAFRIDDITVTQEHSDGKVLLNVKGLIECADDFKGEAVLNITAPDGKEIQKSISVSKNEFSIDAEIENPQIWWSNGLGSQPLYEINVTVSDKDGNKSEKTLKIGLRTLTLDTSPDEYGKNFCFILNGVPVFAKGANFIPPDIFRTRISYEKLYDILLSAKNANMNFIRVWGGGYYESNEFYSICDELGILIWQDMDFACSAYPFRLEDFLENVMEEIKDNINRIKNHACLALYCGNNEIESMSMAWQYNTEVIKDTGKFFYETLPARIREFDSVTPYWACTPSGGEYMKKVNADACGDTHLWHVWHGLRNFEYYRKRFTRFCSEFGLESYPTIPTLKKNISPDKFYFGSDEIDAHQKCDGGDIKMLYYLLDRWWEPVKFEHLIYLTQLSQMECIRDATEHWRRNMNRCHGSLYWQLNDCWPGTSWASLDFLGGYKVLHYKARHFNKPVMVSLENGKNDVKLYVVNDKPEKFNGKLVWKTECFDGTAVSNGECEVSTDGVSAALVCKLDTFKIVKDRRNTAFKAELYDNNGKLISHSCCLFAKENKCKFTNPSITTEITQTADGYNVTLNAKTYARYVCLEMQDTHRPFSDNYFDLSAGESKTVTIKSDLDENTFKNDLSVFSLSDVEHKNSRVFDRFNRARIFMKPWNLANWFSRFFDK